MTASAPAALQRVGPLAKLPSVLADAGVPIAAVLDGLSVNEADLRPEVQLPIGIISAMLERAAGFPGLSEIGLILGEGAGHQLLGAPGQLMMSCDTLGSALGTFVAVQITNSTAGASYLHPVGEDYAWGFGLYAPELPSSHIYDVSAAVGFNLLRELTGGAVQPLELLLSRPVPEHPDVYRRHFRCPVRFNEGQTCLILPGRSMGFRLPSANAALRDSLLRALQGRNQPLSFTARVKHALRPMLLAGRASHRQVAAHLNLHPRTMGRKLEYEGVTFEQLKDEVRLAVARELLARTEVAVSDIGAALGYATPSAFVRAFRRWTESSPSVWRKAERSRELLPVPALREAVGKR